MLLKVDENLPVEAVDSLRAAGHDALSIHDHPPTCYLAQTAPWLISHGPRMPTPLTSETIADLRRQYPRLRDDYFDYLSTVGWGETDAGPTIYSGP
ncbi:MAG: hypothetical protein WD030_07160, partial [Pirellulales bacterium]